MAVTVVVAPGTNAGDVLVDAADCDEQAVAQSPATHISDASQRIRTMVTLPGRVVPIYGLVARYRPTATRGSSSSDMVRRESAVRSPSGLPLRLSQF
jgi:hypothetical protein